MIIKKYSLYFIKVFIYYNNKEWIDKFNLVILKEEQVQSIYFSPHISEH